VKRLLCLTLLSLLASAAFAQFETATVLGTLKILVAQLSSAARLLLKTSRRRRRCRSNQ